MLLSVIIGVGSGLIGLILTKDMLLWMKTPEDIIEKSALYMRIYFLGIPATMVYNFGAAIIRSSGDTRRPLMILSVSGLANVLLNLLFVIVFHMDVAGVAIATIAAQYLSAIAIVRILLTDDAEYKLYLSDLKIHKKELFEVLKYGIPAGLQTSMFSLSNMIIQSSVNSFGSAVMAGNGAAGSIDAFVFAASDSGAQAAMTFSGQNYGAKKLKRVKSSMLYSMLLSTVLGLLFGIVVLIFKQPLLLLYVDSAEALAAGVSRLNTMCGIYFTCGIMNSIANTVRGMGKSVVPMMITMFFVCAFRVAWIYTVFPISRTIETIFVSYPISYILAIFAHSTYFIIVYLKKKKQLKEELV
jgi:putative MATE family efflux protein